MDDLIIQAIDTDGRTRSSCKSIDFNSGYQSLDDYLKKYAFFNHQNGLARVFICCSLKDNKVIYGYYSSSMTSISTKLLLPEDKRGGFPQEIPAMLIGRLAVSQSFQGMGIGKKLLRHGFECAVTVSDKIGIRGICVDAIDNRARAYYLKYGFISFYDKADKLFIPMETIKSIMN